jgi:hypothetical protein
MGTPDASPGHVHIGFPTTCRYTGGHLDLGDHGYGLRIEDGRIGHGGMHLTHSIPLGEVTGVTIAQRGNNSGTSDWEPGVAFGLVDAWTVAGFGEARHHQKLTTDISVRTRGGQVAHWLVHEQGGGWVQQWLAPVLKAAGIPLG